MKTQVRILLLAALVALVAGLAGMKRGNDALEARMATAGGKAP
jgi:hypothetical protein